MPPIILDARSLQLASEVLGLLDVRALLERRPFPEQPAPTEAQQKALTVRLAQLLSGLAESHAFSPAEVELLVRCCRGSDEAPTSRGTPWPHAWRYEPLFLHLLERRPASTAACREVVAEFLLPQVHHKLQGTEVRSASSSRGGHPFPPALFEEERQRLGQQLAALEGLRAETQADGSW